MLIRRILVLSVILFYSGSTASPTAPPVTRTAPTNVDESAHLDQIKKQQYITVDPTEDEWKTILSTGQLEMLQVYSIESPLAVTDQNLEAIGTLKKLKTLVIGSESVTDKTLNSLANHPSLEAIVFFESPLTDSGLLKLSTVKNLKTVGLYKTGITEAGLREAEKKMPTVHIEVYDPRRFGEVFDMNGCLNSRFVKKHIDPLYAKSQENHSASNPSGKSP